jgi:hypothetical protein
VANNGYSRMYGIVKHMYSSSRLVTLLKLGWGGPLGEELLRSSVAEVTCPPKTVPVEM